MIEGKYVGEKSVLNLHICFFFLVIISKHYNVTDYLYSSYFILDDKSNLGLIWHIQEAMHGIYANLHKELKAGPSTDACL